MRNLIPVWLFLAALSLTPALPLQAQSAESRIQQNKAELEKIRKERADLERRMKSLQVSSRSLAEKLDNITKQHNATARAVKALDKQLTDINDAVKETTHNLAQAEQEAEQKRGVLKRRMVDIYKRGPLFDIEVLLSAKSFGALLARYKYLHELAVSDRALAERVEALRDTIRSRRQQLVSLQSDLTKNKSEKVKEEGRLRALEKRQQGDLKKVQADATRAKNRLAQLAQAEARVNNLIASLEAARKKAAGGAAPPTTSTIKTSDRGQLAWPVDGSIIYDFGVTTTPNGTKIRWNGIGISAASGSPVKAVASGVVRVTEPVGTYGRTIIIEHGGGDYSVYGSLAAYRVKVGEKVTKGQVIGTVGSSDPDQPPHLHFEIRRQGPPVDPTTWLRNAR